MRSYVLIATALVMGSASAGPLPADLASRATPSQWKEPARVLFRVFDSHDRSLGSFTLELTNIPARTCIAGDWFKAVPISSDLTVLDLEHWWTAEGMIPSYQISGQRLTVELNGSDLCDAYTEVTAQLSDTGAKGFLSEGGIFGGKRYGRVTVSRL